MGITNGMMMLMMMIMNMRVRWTVDWDWDWDWDRGHHGGLQYRTGYGRVHLLVVEYKWSSTRVPEYQETDRKQMMMILLLVMVLDDYDHDQYQ